MSRRALATLAVIAAVALSAVGGQHARLRIRPRPC